MAFRRKIWKKPFFCILATRRTSGELLRFNGCLMDFQAFAIKSVFIIETSS